ncbi:MAG: TlpA family protein disulfide reductase [Spirochaetaceae bacterium]|jgi:thiol-disulfide isomerase/thioredoxin|nr:TlpA family protein disulfide reductase [Spirochaetaceae bacterium]
MNSVKFNIHALKKIILCAAAMTAAASVSANEIVRGQTAPDFTFTSTVPPFKQQKLSDYRGKPVALHFWATWCGPCIRELPLIAGLSAKSDDITVLAVNCGEPEKDVSSFLSKRKIKLNLVLDEKGGISNLYNITAIPQTFMIDADGVIQSAQTGSYNKKGLDQAVSALLKNEPSPPEGRRIRPSL